MPPSDGSQPSMASQSPFHSRDIRTQGDVAQTVDQPIDCRTMTENDPVEASNTPRRKKKKPLHVEIDILNDGSGTGPGENVDGNVEGLKKKKKKKRNVPLDGEQGEDTERLTPKKKKKRKPKVPEGEGEGELPPLVMRGRPLPTLPTLPSGGQHEESPC